MHLTLDPDFTHGAWPGPLRGREAVVGEEWVGPGRLAQLLTGALGLPGEAVGASDRAARLAQAVTLIHGFWSESASTDPLGTARRLIEWRDRLAMAGWTGASGQPRLAALGQLMRSAHPGLPDRLQWIEKELRTRDAGVETLRLVTPRADFAPLWQRVFDALESAGTRILEVVPSPAEAKGDLAAARHADFAPTGDPSITLLRPAGPMQAAEEVAAWLASLGDDAFDGTVIIGADPVLDAALERHGLPTVGPRYEVADDAMFQLLPLVLEMLWAPQDPQRAYELLLLHPSLVPGDAARWLRRALQNWPAVGSDEWDETMQKAIAGITEPEARQRIAARMKSLWATAAKREDGVSREAVIERVQLLREWLQARLDTETGTESMKAALKQCRVFRRLVMASTETTVSEPQLRRLVAEATRSLASASPFRARAGFASVDTPGSIAGPARRIVWWNFNGSSVFAERRMPLTQAELDDLAAQGVVLPLPEQAAASQAAHWQRPLMQATETLLLVCPMVGPTGESQHPHPLWDEIAARVPSGPEQRERLDRLECRSLATRVDMQPREKLARPQPVREWKVPQGRIDRRETESPSSIETFLGCPLKWVFDHVARLRGFDDPSLPNAEDPRLLGNLMHELINQMFLHGVPDPSRVTAEAERLFDRELSRHAAPLALPGAETERAQARRIFVRTAERMSELLARTGSKLLESEQTQGGFAFGTEFEGTPDLVIGPPRRVLDLKWGRATYLSQSLERGTAFQLAAYSYLTSDGDVFPGVAYFIMGAQKMFTTAPELFPGAEPVEGPSPKETWDLYQKVHAERWTRIESGHIEALGVPKGDEQVPKETTLNEGVLTVEPPCKICDYAAMCGRAFRQEEA